MLLGLEIQIKIAIFFEVIDKVQVIKNRKWGVIKTCPTQTKSFKVF